MKKKSTSKQQNTSKNSTSKDSEEKKSGGSKASTANKSSNSTKSSNKSSSDTKTSSTKSSTSNGSSTKASDTKKSSTKASSNGSKPAAKKSSAGKAPMNMDMGKSGDKQHHVVPHARGWAIHKAGTSRAYRVFETKQEAVKMATDMAKRMKTELVIHNQDGAIGEKNSYGKDPSPPKG